MLRPPVDALARMIATARANAHRRVEQLLRDQLATKRRGELDALLAGAYGQTSGVADLRRRAARTGVKELLGQVQQYRRLVALGAPQIDVSALPLARRRALETLGRRMTAQQLRRLEPARRHPLLLVLLHALVIERGDELLDQFDKLLRLSDGRANDAAFQAGLPVVTEQERTLSPSVVAGRHRQRPHPALLRSRKSAVPRDLLADRHDRRPAKLALSGHRAEAARQVMTARIRSMRWVVTLEGKRPDVERLLAEASEGLSAAGDPRQARLEFEDADHNVASDEARQAGRVAIEAVVRHLNGFGKLRWGRTFEGVAVKTVECVDSSGRSGQVVFVGRAVEHILPEDFGARVERLGFPRPALPDGLEDVNALNLAKVMALADRDPEVARALHLVELMLEGDDDIDWAAGYAALEVIEQNALRRGVSGQALGWWTDNEHRRFTQMANSVEAVGIRSRHQGRQYDAPKKRLTAKDGSWFVRRVTARWLAWLLEANPVRDP